MKLHQFLQKFFQLVLKHSAYVITVLVFLDVLIISFYFFLNLYTYKDTQEQYTSKEVLQLSRLVSARTDGVAGLTQQIAEINKAYTDLQNTDPNKKIADLESQIDNVNTAFSNYTNLQTQISQAQTQGVKTDSFTSELNNITNLLLTQKFTDAIASEGTLTTEVTNAQNQLIQQKQQASSQVAMADSLPGSSFATTTVSAEGRNFSVYYITIDLTAPGLKVITDTLNTDDCANSCPVTNLMDFYNKNHGFAAINGTYLCPDTYPSCAGKTNSFNFPVYNTNLQKWIDKANLFWTDRSMFTFNTANQPTFYPQANAYSGADSNYQVYPPVNAGIVMAPGLVSNGQIIVNNFPLDTKSSSTYTTRGAMGTKGNTLILAFAFNATVPDMAYVAQAMGMTNALNIDGGGSTAMIYNGQYKLGPGRNIPNAIIFAH